MTHPNSELMKGNKNALGNKGGGRKGYMIEKNNAKLLHEFFYEDHSLEEIEEKLKTGQHSIKDQMIFKALQGNEGFIKLIFDRVFPKDIDINDLIKALRPELFEEQENKMFVNIWGSVKNKTKDNLEETRQKVDLEVPTESE